MARSAFDLHLSSLSCNNALPAYCRDTIYLPNVVPSVQTIELPRDSRWEDHGRGNLLPLLFPAQQLYERKSEQECSSRSTVAQISYQAQ